MKFLTPQAYYNEIDPYAAQWLRNLIAAGHIAPGFVDTRSIEDVRPDDLRGFTQCHFFAGIGGWPLALRRAGWRDDRPVWSGSCPCQPFSAAGKGAGFADERHLWPAFNHLIAEREPAAIFGEQVASSAVDVWIDLVHADLEALGYAFGSVPFPSAGVGAPHIRDRNYWVAYATNQRHERPRTARRGRNGSANSRHIGSLADTDIDGSQGRTEQAVFGTGRREEGNATGCGGAPLAELGSLADAAGIRCDEQRTASGPSLQGKCAERSGEHARSKQVGIVSRGFEGLGSSCDTGPTNGLWRDADWLGCTDGKWRPVEPGTFPLAHGVSGRVGRLRAYGNAINPEAAQAFIESVM